jgi:NADH:ubiquinone oxidoreductase subunit
MGVLLRALQEYGLAGTWRKLYAMRQIKFGTLVGVDKYGNKYYENRVDYPLNQHRWIEYAGGKSAYEADASNVPPEWHGWLHSTTTEPPTDVRVCLCARVRHAAAAAVVAVAAVAAAAVLAQCGNTGRQLPFRPP